MLSSKKMPTLITERLTLRQLSINDAEEIFLLRSDEKINKFLERKPCKTNEDALNFIKAILINEEAYYWAITKTGNEKLIGTICLFDLTPHLKKYEIGYELRPEYQGQGIMREAAMEVIRYAIDTLGIKHIEASTHKNNNSSTKLLQKLNFKEPEPDKENKNLLVFRFTNKS